MAILFSVFIVLSPVFGQTCNLTYQFNLKKDKTLNEVESNCPEARPKLARAMREEIKKVSPLDFQTGIIPIANFVKTIIHTKEKIKIFITFRSATGAKILGNADSYKDKLFRVKVYFPPKEISVTYLPFRILLQTSIK